MFTTIPQEIIFFFVPILDRDYRVVCRYQDGVRRAKPLARIVVVAISVFCGGGRGKFFL